MMTPPMSVVHPRSSRLLAVLLVVVAVLSSPQTATAGNDWCSRDPVFAFSRDHTVLPYTLDVQVQAPLSSLPIAGTATLDVLIPANVRATVVDVPTPGFTLETRIVPSKPHARASRYPVDLELFVPASGTSFPVRIVLTDPQRAALVVVEGIAGESLHTSYHVGF